MIMIDDQLLQSLDFRFEFSDSAAGPGWQLTRWLLATCLASKGLADPSKRQGVKLTGIDTGQDWSIPVPVVRCNNNNL